MTFEATRGGFGYEQPTEGETNDWLTPPNIVAKLGAFDLDPCGCATSPFRLAKETYLLPEQDGLLLPWHGLVFCNPPYGQHVGKWADKMAQHRNGVLLIFSRVETKAWEGIWKNGDCFLFPFGRISFIRSNGVAASSGTAPSAFIAYGETAVQMLRDSGMAGALIYRDSILQGERVSKLSKRN